MKRRDFLVAAASAGVTAAGIDLGRRLGTETAAPSTDPSAAPSSTPSAPSSSTSAPAESAVAASPDPAATAELQARIDALAETGGTVVIARGIHALAAPLRIPGSFITLQGDGMGATVLDWRGPGAAIVNSDRSRRRDGLTVRDLSIDNNEAPEAGGIVLDQMQHVLIERCRFQAIGSGAAAIEFRGSSATYYNTVRSSWVNCSLAGSTGIRWTANDGQPNANRVIDTILSGGPGSTLLDIAAGDTALILGCGVEGGHLLSLAASFCQVIGTRFESGLIEISGNYNQLVGNSYANSVELVDRGLGNILIGEIGGLAAR